MRYSFESLFQKWSPRNSGFIASKHSAATLWNKRQSRACTVMSPHTRPGHAEARCWSQVTTKHERIRFSHLQAQPKDSCTTILTSTSLCISRTQTACRGKPSHLFFFIFTELFLAKRPWSKNITNSPRETIYRRVHQRGDMSNAMQLVTTHTSEAYDREHSKVCSASLV